jgi:hypothetical protein
MSARMKRRDLGGEGGWIDAMDRWMESLFLFLWSGSLVVLCRGCRLSLWLVCERRRVYV